MCVRRRGPWAPFTAIPARYTCWLLLSPETVEVLTRPMSAYAFSLTTPPEGGARGSHLPAHVGRGTGDLSQAWSSQIRRSGDLRLYFAAVDGLLRRLRERDGAIQTFGGAESL